MAEKKPKAYTVGYGRPPKHTQFKPGQSGNPGGRPKGSKSFAAITANILNKRILMKTPDGEGRRTIKEALIWTHMQKALKGDTKSLIAVLRLSTIGENEQASSEAGRLDAEDEAIIAEFLKHQSAPKGRSDDDAERT